MQASAALLPDDHSQDGGRTFAETEMPNDDILSSKGLTLYQGTISLTNILLGIGLLSMPFAMSLSGEVGLILIALVCLLFNSSGKFIAWGLDLIPDSSSGHIKGYPELGQAAFGVAGRRLVTVAASFEIFAGSCMMFIILWRTIQQLLPTEFDSFLPPWLPMETAAILVGVLIEVPLCVWGSFKTLSPFSTLGVVSTGVVTTLVIILPLADPQKLWVHEASPHHVVGVTQQVFAATGIMAVSVAGHSCFPSVRAGMADPRQFPTAVNIAYVIICTVVCGVGGIGYWYWGDSAQVLVTDDFARHSPYMGLNIMGVGIRHIVQLLVAVNIATTIPLLVFPLEDILLSVVKGDHPSDDSVPGALEATLLPTFTYVYEAEPSGDDTGEIFFRGSDKGQLDTGGNVDGFKDNRSGKSAPINPLTVPNAKNSPDGETPPVPKSGRSAKTPVDTPPMHLTKRKLQQGNLPVDSGKAGAGELNMHAEVATGASSSNHLSFGQSRSIEIPIDHAEESVESPLVSGGAIYAGGGGVAGGWIARSAIVAVIVLFSVTSRNSLEAVESVVGAVCEVMSGLLLPTLFYLAIQKRVGKVGFGLWLAGGVIFVFGIGLMTQIILQTFSSV